MQKASRHASVAAFIAAALALGLALPGTARAQSTTYTACYVPDVGAVYMIGQQDTPSSCLESSHVEFTFGGGDSAGVTDHGNLSGLSDDDHPTYVREGEAAAGDLGGSYPDPSVVGLQGNPVDSAAPADGELLGWDGTAGQWAPTSAPGGVTDHGNLTGLSDDDHPQYVLDSNGVITVNDGWMGVNRSHSIGAEAFGVQADATSGSYGGMYMETTASDARPFYGYATSGSSNRWTYYDGGTERWHVYNQGVRLTVASDGNVGIGTTSPSSKLSVLHSADFDYAGEFVIDNSSNPNRALYAETVGSGEALRVNVASSTNSNDALFVRHRGTGPLITAMTASSSATNIRFRVDNDGNVTADGTISGGGADVAEAFDVEGRAESYEPGDVLVVSTEEDRTVTRSSTARSSRVVGVYATRPGVLLTEHGTETDLDSRVPMGVVGVIPTKVSAENGSIDRGDLLVTAEAPGHAMKAKPKVIEGMEVYPQGAIIGKALEAFDGPGTGTIEVMVNVK